MVSTSAVNGPRILDVADLVRDLASTYAVRELAFDPWRAGQLAQELEREGMRVSVFPQNDGRMCPASVRLYDAIIDQRKSHSAGAVASGA